MGMGSCRKFRTSYGERRHTICDSSRNPATHVTSSRIMRTELPSGASYESWLQSSTHKKAVNLKIQRKIQASMLTAALALIAVDAQAGCGSAFCSLNTNWSTQGAWTEP